MHVVHGVHTMNVDIVVRGVEKELVLRIRADAILRGESFKQWIVRVVSEKASVSDVRSRVRDQDGGREGSTSARTVQRPSASPPTDAGTVDGSVQQNPGGKGTSEEVWLGPPHSKTCKCRQCESKRGNVQSDMHLRGSVERSERDESVPAVSGTHAAGGSQGVVGAMGRERKGKGDPKSLGSCSYCGTPMIEWGTNQLHCPNCRRNFPR